MGHGDLSKFTRKEGALIESKEASHKTSRRLLGPSLAAVLPKISLIGAGPLISAPCPLTKLRRTHLSL